MAGRDSFLLLSLLGLWWCSLYQGAQGEYLITVPKEIIAGIPTQFCIFNTDPGAPTGSIDVSIGEGRFGVALKQVLNTTIVVPEGKDQYCEDLLVDNVDYYHRVHMNITGALNNKKLNHTVQLGIRRQVSERVFIQSDKHFYQAGETVQFRILTISGPRLNVSTDNYPEVWVEAPSKTRIAQWLNVSNTDGIVHLSMDLVDEPEEGYYNIRLKTKEGNSKSQNFRVGEYVLPRFDLEIQRPSFTLFTDESFNFTVCAKYTFGQPVKGHLVVNITNNKNELCRVDFTKKVNVTGCQSFEFTTADMQVTDCNVYSMPVSVSFEEEGTGIQMTERSSISINRKPISFEKIYADKYMKPNLPMTVKVKAKYPDSTPASGISVEVCAAERCNNMTTAPDGIFTAVLPIYKTNRIFMKTLNCRAHVNSASYSNGIKHMHSPSNSSLLIFAPEEELKCSSSGPLEHILPVMFSATNQTSAFITVQVMSRGQMQFTSTKEYQFTSNELPISAEHLVEPIPPSPKGSVRGVLNIPISLPTSASPTAKILIWYKKNDGEVVSDMRELSVQKCLRNSANLSWAIEQGQPGDETILSLAAKPNSVCSLGVVDRSTLLLSEASDKISLSRLFDYANTFKISRYTPRQVKDYDYCRDKEIKGRSLTVIRHYGYHSYFVDALHMFDNADLFVFSDLTIETRPCEKRVYLSYTNGRPSPQSSAGFGGSGGSGGFGGSGGSGGFVGDVAEESNIQPEKEESFEQDEKEDTTSQTNSPRTDFPETWLWDVVVVPASGVLNQKVTLPDTITEWVGNAVCALPTEGVGLSEETSITTFLPFFIDLTLPPSIKRGEILPVKISVFNYLGQTLPVTIRLEESPEYEILEEQSSTSGPKGQITTCLAAQDNDVLTVRIDSKELGDVNLTVTAYVDYGNSPDCVVGNQSVSRTDTIIKPIKVEPEGYPREKTWTKYICSEDFETGEDSLEVWDVSLPQKIVQGSERGWVSGVGDLLALSLENLGHLIRMPYGCGEQNMLKFAPNIFLMNYLDTTKQNNPQISEKLKRFMTTGYRRELLYRHRDGSFSAFGSADDSGSTWLTAFVLKSFAQAQPYILIDKKSLNQTRKWLLENQDEDGCFLSIGKVFQKGMKGGITGGNNSIPLTTYVTISLLEAGENPLSSNISSAIKCMNSNKTTDPYTLALKAYAFALANHSQAQETIQQLLGFATVEKSAMYWDLPRSPSKSRSVELETAAYALLAMLEIDYETYKTHTTNIVKWITTKRNGRGGFYSTQDTVMALQALARFETFRFQGALNTKATVKAANLTHAFTITESNKLLQQQVSLPKLPTNVTLTTEGQGCAVLQAVLRYNIPDPEPSDAFDLTVNARTEPDRLCKTKLITACASYRLEDGQSNMAVIEVNLVSGYIPEKEDLKQLVRNNRDVIKRYEVDGNKVSFYIEELTAKSTCVNFKITREVDVENVKPGTVVVYDYYQPEFSISENYILPPPEECR